MVTTPQVSLQQFSPSPAGATNATTGLVAGATNSTLSQLQGSTSSVYTVGLWYQGGAPLMTPQVRLWPETIGREGQVMHEAPHDANGGVHPREEGPRAAHPHETRSREERAAVRSEEAVRPWTYFSGREGTTASTSVVKEFKKAGRTYGNDDVTRQNEKNGAVKYDSKTEKL
jgi:hypothetical protein